jgi:hypothetical protein
VVSSCGAASAFHALSACRWVTLLINKNSYGNKKENSEKEEQISFASTVDKEKNRKIAINCKSW